MQNANIILLLIEYLYIYINNINMYCILGFIIPQKKYLSSQKWNHSGLTTMNELHITINRCNIILGPRFFLLRGITEIRGCKWRFSTCLCHVMFQGFSVLGFDWNGKGKKTNNYYWNFHWEKKNIYCNRNVFSYFFFVYRYI